MMEFSKFMLLNVAFFLLDLVSVHIMYNLVSR